METLFLMKETEKNDFSHQFNWKYLNLLIPRGELFTFINGVIYLSLLI